MKGLKHGGLTVSFANRNARVQVAICTIHATMYANWYGMTVDTMRNKMMVVMILRLVEEVVKAGIVLFRLGILETGVESVMIPLPSIIISYPGRSRT